MNLKFKITLLLVMLMNISMFAQDAYTLKGVVTSKADNSAIPGVTVRVLKTTAGVSTDFNGKFEISVKKGDVVRIFLFGLCFSTGHN